MIRNSNATRFLRGKNNIYRRYLDETLGSQLHLFKILLSLLEHPLLGFILTFFEVLIDTATG
jgi:hypothetical protein